MEKDSDSQEAKIVWSTAIDVAVKDYSQSSQWNSLLNTLKITLLKGVQSSQEASQASYFKQVAEAQAKVADIGEAFLSGVASAKESVDTSKKDLEKLFVLHNSSQSIIGTVLISASYSGKPVSFLKKIADDQARKE